MRISIFLNRDLESNIALNCLLPALQEHSFNLYISEKVGSNKSPLIQLQNLAFLEQKFVNEYLFPELENASYKGFLSFDQISRQYDSPLLVLDEITSPNTLSHLKAFQPDLFLSIRFGKIFKGEVLTIPKHGIINLHSAILPDYKGVLGTFRAMLNKDKEIGSTIHYIGDSTIDTGNIIDIYKYKVDKSKSVLWHIVNLYPQSVQKLIDIISKISNHKIIDMQPQASEGNYYSFPTASGFEKLKTNRILLYDLNEYAEMIKQFYKIDPVWTLSMLKEKGKFKESL